MNQLTKAAKTLAAKYNSTSLILRIAIGLVVGSVLIPGAKAPKLVTRDMLREMEPELGTEA